MATQPINDNTRLDSLTSAIAHRLNTDRTRIYPYGDAVDLLNGLFALFGSPATHLLAAGVATPEIAQAADRCGHELAEILSESPFAGDLSTVTSAVSSPNDILYLANPNRVTGATYSLAEMESMARAVPQGALIVDEHNFDHFGVTAFPLTDFHSKVVCLRSFAGLPTPLASGSGFVLASPSAVDRIDRSHRGYVFRRAHERTAENTLLGDRETAMRLRLMHAEALRVACALETLGLQCRLTPTDFLLLRVADPKEFGNGLARERVPIVNLDGYPQMKNYLRYHIAAVSDNDRLIRCVERMSPSCYRLKTRDQRPASWHRAREVTLNRSAGDPFTATWPGRRESTVTKVLTADD